MRANFTNDCLLIILRIFRKVGEMAKPSIKCRPCKHEDLNLISRNYVKVLGDRGW